MGRRGAALRLLRGGRGIAPGGAKEQQEVRDGTDDEGEKSEAEPSGVAEADGASRRWRHPEVLGVRCVG